MGKKNNNSSKSGKKSNKVEWSHLIEKAVDISGTDNVLSAVSKKCGAFNEISDLKTYISDELPQDDRSTRGWLANSLKKLGKVPKGNKYAHFSKAGDAASQLSYDS